MKNLDGIINKIDTYINGKEQIRDQALRSSRDIIIKCRKAIQRLHRKAMIDAQEFITKSSEELTHLYEITKEYPDLFHAGFVENAAQEFVEAQCLFNIMNGDDLPDPDSLQTTYSAYLLGLCDVVGELRRGALDLVMKGETERAYEYLEFMDMIYDAIMQLDYPSGLVPIKRKQDIARNLIEKTRGELAVASCERRIDDRTNEFRGLLDQVNHQEKTKEKKKPNSLDLDVDQVY